MDNPDLCPPDIHIFTSTKQPWVTLPPGAKAVPELYDINEVWPAESLDRRRRLISACLIDSSMAPEGGNRTQRQEHVGLGPQTGVRHYSAGASNLDDWAADDVLTFWRNWRGHNDVMQTRSIRGSGEPAWVIASLNACLRLGPDPRRALWPAATSAAQTGRTHDRTRPMLQMRQKVLAKAAPCARACTDPRALP
jgi:hypothetical protein